VHRCIEDEVRKLGAMDVLISDQARSQMSKKLHDILRTFGIDDWQSEPHNKNQNFAERAWKDTKLLANQVLDHSGASRSAWVLALSHVCLLLNHVARKSLNWRTPIEWLLGFTPDITVLLAFVF
jgi:transposase InsO family protein